MISSESSTMVKGPSLIRETIIWAPKIPCSTTGISFAGSHSRRWGEAVEADSDDEFDYYFCFDPFFMGRRYRFPITAAAGGSYDQRDDDRYTGQSVLGTFVLLLFG